jgi:hypothetical protein
MHRRWKKIKKPREINKCREIVNTNWVIFFRYRIKNEKIDLTLMKIPQKNLKSIHIYRDYKAAMINKNKVFLQDSLKKEVEANIENIYDHYSKEEK